MGDTLDFVIGHANGNELLQAPIVVQDPQRAVARLGLIDGRSDNALEELLEGDLADKFQAGLMKRN